MRILVTGGLGCVGVNYAAHRLRAGDDVIVLDDQSRGESCRLNLDWLRAIRGKGRFVSVNGSVANRGDVFHALTVLDDPVDALVHCAAQSSVDQSMVDPGGDFESNVLGTFTVLETLRKTNPECVFIFMASNKVWDVTDWPVELAGSRYEFTTHASGPSEDRPFATDAVEPYGASKICGFYYTRCYAALYGMNAVICVPSGMAGPRQYGKSEQGWLGYFCIANELGLSVPINGDGYQVRDMLHTDDVCAALDILIKIAPSRRGEVFNLGGGIRNAVSLWEALDMIEACSGTRPKVYFRPWREKDNKVYVSNIEKMESLGWKVTRVVGEIISDICLWARDNRDALRVLYA